MKAKRKPAVLKALLVLAGATAAVHLGSALTLDRSLEYTELTYRSERLSGALDGYVITFLTDIHGYPQHQLEAMAEELSARGTDLILLGGDFSGQEDLSRCLEIIASIRPADGVWGVEGNHDDYRVLGAAMEAQGMTLLENQGRLIREGLYVAGTQDLWNRAPDLDKALEGAGEEDFVVAVSHNPDTAMEQDFSRVDLALSGHIHGGEVTLFGLYGPAMGHVSNYGQRFLSGWCKTAAGTDLYVSRGIGTHFMRCFARPQVIRITLKA